MDVYKAGLRWSRTWQEAWPAKDAEAIVDLQAPDGLHRASPFRPVYKGKEGLRSYLVSVFDEEIEPTVCRFGEPLVRDGHAAVEYWAQSHYADGPMAIAGITLVTFDAEGLVAEARDYSFVQQGVFPFPPHLPE
ncbi:nuclear transport factor 2 family protein [Nonomuraea sp. NPDC049480]|uniref:nuclear transport factor 2 family protein n=1 Tax=Nonomuraea sp. NPDC049480 TaxID=3364353 RepID=UPI003790C93C